MIQTRKLVGVFAAGLLTLTACGSDDDSSSETTAAPSVTETPAATEAPSGTEVSDGTAAPATGDAVEIGFANLEGGAGFSLPDVRRGFQAAINYVNDQGGVNGHPIDATICNTELTPESSINCTNEFVDKGVVMHVGGIDYVIDASLPILQEAGIVHVSSYAYGPATNVAVGDAFISSYPNEEAMPASLLMHETFGNESIAFVLPDVPAMTATMNDIVTPTADELGLTATPFFYPPAGADWATIAATVMTSNPDGITMFGVDPDCISAVQAFRDAGFEGTIHAGTCTQILTELDDSTLENVVVGAQYYTPFIEDLPADVQADMDIFIQSMDADGGGEYNVSYAQQGFQTGMFVASILSQVQGDYTAESVKAAAAKAKGHNFFRGDNDYDCGKPVWVGTTACGTGNYFAESTGGGMLTILPDQPQDVTPVLPS